MERETAARRALPAVVEDGGLLAPHTPMPEAEAADLARTHFGVRGSLRRFTTEKDDTFGIEADQGRYVLKVANPAESADEVSLQTGLIEHVAAADPALPVPAPIRDREGRPFVVVEDRAGQVRLVRLLSYLAGTPLSQTTASPQERALVGRMLGRLRLACAGFVHPADSRALAWDVQHVQSLRPLLTHISAQEHRRLLEQALDRLLGLQPALLGLRRQVLHNDFNMPNILVLHGHRDFVTGVLDFGDAVRTAIAIDAATAIVDHLPERPDDYARPDIFGAPAEVLRGYLAVADLSATEIELVPHLMMARIVALGLITTLRAELFPGNAPYILRRTALAWPQLRWFLDRSAQEVSQLFAQRLHPPG